MPRIEDQSRTDEFLDGITRQAHEGQFRTAATLGMVAAVSGAVEMNKPGRGTPAQKFALGASTSLIKCLSFGAFCIGVIWFLAAFGFGSGGHFDLLSFIFGVLCCSPFVYLRYRRYQQRLAGPPGRPTNITSGFEHLHTPEGQGK